MKKHPSLRSARGAALVELAAAITLLALVLVGTTDFARVFYTSIALTNAARAGAQYGTHNTGQFDDDAGIRAAAIAAAPNIGLATGNISIGRPCVCATDAGVFSAPSPNNCLGSCGGNHMVYVLTVTASKTFSTTAPYPGIPSPMNLSRGATQRVAN